MDNRLEDGDWKHVENNSGVRNGESGLDKDKDLGISGLWPYNRWFKSCYRIPWSILALLFSSGCQLSCVFCVAAVGVGLLFVFCLYCIAILLGLPKETVEPAFHVRYTHLSQIRHFYLNLTPVD